MLPLSGFDYGIVAIVLLIGLKGLFNGTVRELFGLAGLSAGVWTASVYAQKLGAWIGSQTDLIDSPSALSLIGFVTIVASLWLLAVILGGILLKFTGQSHHSAFDRAGGMVLASLKVFVIVAVTLHFLFRIEFVEKSFAPKVSDSALFPWLMKTGAALTDDAPDSATESESKHPTLTIRREKSS